MTSSLRIPTLATRYAGGNVASCAFAAQAGDEVVGMREGHQVAALQTRTGKPERPTR